MINVIISDKFQNSKDFLTSYAKKNKDIVIIGVFDDINSVLNSKQNLDEADLIIFDISSDNSDETLEIIKKLKDKYKNLNFIATSYEINSELVTKTLKEGAREFLLKPLIPNILESAIKKITDKKNNIKPKNANTICVFSNKGGVGKTSIAVNVAYEIAQKTGEKVCLLDLSFNSEDIATFLNIEPKFSIDFILNNIETSDEKLLLSLMNKYEDTSLYIFSPQNDINLNLKYTPHSTNKIINSLKHIFSYIVIDTASIIDETSVSIINNSDLILLIGMLNLASIRNMQKCRELFDNMGYKNDKIKLIINRYIENSEISTKDIEKTVGKEIFQKIPNNYLTLIDAINIGKTVKEINPQSNIAKAYDNLAKEIINTDFLNIASKQYNHGVFNLLRRMGE